MILLWLPEFKAEVSAKDKVDYYTIEVTDEMVDNQVKAYTQRNGKYDKVDVYEDNDMLKGLLADWMKKVIPKRVVFRWKVL